MLFSRSFVCFFCASSLLLFISSFPSLLILLLFVCSLSVRSFFVRSTILYLFFLLIHTIKLISATCTQNQRLAFAAPREPTKFQSQLAVQLNSFRSDSAAVRLSSHLCVFPLRRCASMSLPPAPRRTASTRSSSTDEQKRGEQAIFDSSSGSEGEATSPPPKERGRSSGSTISSVGPPLVCARWRSVC